MYLKVHNVLENFRHVNLTALTLLQNQKAAHFYVFLNFTFANMPRNYYLWM